MLWRDISKQGWTWGCLSRCNKLCIKFQRKEDFFFFKISGSLAEDIFFCDCSPQSQQPDVHFSQPSAAARDASSLQSWFECSCPRFGSEPHRSPSLEPRSSFDPRSWVQAMSRALPRFWVVPGVFHGTDASRMVIDFLMTFCIFDHLPRKMAKVGWTLSYSIPSRPRNVSCMNRSIASHQLPAVAVRLNSTKYWNLDFRVRNERTTVFFRLKI